MKKLVLAAAVAAVSLPVLAEPKNNKAEEIIVTATRTKQTYAETLSAVTVFTRADIEKYQATSLPELLSKAPGISFTSSGGRGANKSLLIRGNKSKHSLVLIDGVRVGSATLGSTAIENIDPEMVERIEIVRGPKSSIYGSDALGGVINIITRQANNKTPVVLKVGRGNNDTNTASMNYGRKGEKFQASVTASYVYTDGIDNTESKQFTDGDNDAYRQKTIGFTGSYELTNDVSLAGAYQLSSAENEYDTGCKDYSNYPIIIPFACSPYTKSDKESYNISLDVDINSLWASSITLGGSEDESESLFDIGPASTSLFKTEKLIVNWQNDLQINDDLLLTLGYDYLKDEVSGTTIYDEGDRDNNAAYAQLQAGVGSWSANLGARNDDNEQFGSHDTYNVSVGYDLNQELKVVLSYSEAFKAPTFNELYYPGFGNPDWVPEETEAYEIAIKGFFEAFNWGISAYQNDVSNLIEYNQKTYVTEQINSATINGVEFDINGDVVDVEYNVSLTLLDTENDDSGNELARRPDQTLNIDLDYRFDKWSIGTSFYAVSSRYNDADNSETLSGYSTVALRTAYRINDEIKIQLKVDNIFEKNYVTSAGGLGDFENPGIEALFSVVYTPEF